MLTRVMVFVVVALFAAEVEAAQEACQASLSRELASIDSASVIASCESDLASDKTGAAHYATARAHLQAGDNENAMAHLIRGAELGHLDAQMAAGAAYLAGTIVERNTRASADWYERAAKQGNRDAMYTLALIYTEGDFKDDKVAGSWMQQAALKGHVEAMYALGVMYLRGQGMPQSYPSARSFLELAAKRGHARAAFTAGQIYFDAYRTWGGPSKKRVETGLWLNQDELLAESDKWTDLAVELGDPYAAAFASARDAQRKERAEEFRNGMMVAAGTLLYLLSQGRDYVENAPKVNTPSYAENLCNAGREAFAWGGDPTYMVYWC